MLICVEALATGRTFHAATTRRLWGSVALAHPVTRIRPSCFRQNHVPQLQHTWRRALSLSSLDVALCSAIDEGEPVVPPIPTPEYTLQVKACVSASSPSEGVAIGFYCFESPSDGDADSSSLSDTDEDNHHNDATQQLGHSYSLGGSAYFKLHRSAFEAYYSAIHASLEYITQQPQQAGSRPIRSVLVQCDHDMVIHQLNDVYDIQRPMLQTLYGKIMELKEERFDSVRFEFIPSSANTKAGQYAMTALGSQGLSFDPDHAHFVRMKDPLAASTATSRARDDDAVPNPPNNTQDSLDPVVDSVSNEDDTDDNILSPLSQNAATTSPDHLYILEFDGGSRGNPGGAAGAGMVLYDTGISGQGKHEIWAGWDYLGYGQATNNQAEYTGLIKGLEAALERGVRKIAVYGDSELIIKHITGEYRVRNAKLIPLWQQTKELLEKFDSYSVHHIRRNLNSRADGLANFAMDEQESGCSD